MVSIELYPTWKSERGKKELALAKENSITHSSFDFYTSKMERLNASLSNSH